MLWTNARLRRSAVVLGREVGQVALQQRIDHLLLIVVEIGQAFLCFVAEYKISHEIYTHTHTSF